MRHESWIKYCCVNNDSHNNYHLTKIPCKTTNYIQDVFLDIEKWVAE